MSLKAMIFTSDRRVSTTFAAAVAELPFDWALVEDVPLALQLVQKERFDLLLIDLTGEGGSIVIRKAQKSEVNHASVMFAVSRQAASTLQRSLGADLYLTNPHGLKSLSTRLREELPLIRHERRWPRRCPVNFSILLQRNSELIAATVLNVSQGGMRIRLEDHVESYDALKFEIALAAKRMHLYGKVVWRGAECDAGIRFLGLTNEQKRLLADWVLGQPEL